MREISIDLGPSIGTGDIEVIKAATSKMEPGDHLLLSLEAVSYTHLDVYKRQIYTEGDDTNEITDPVTPHLRAIDAVNMEDLAFTDALQGGVTTVMTGPGSANVIGGLSAVLKTSAKTVDQAVMKNPAGLKAAFGENPKRVYGTQKKMPATRMATAAPVSYTHLDVYKRQGQRGQRACS